MRNPVLRGDLRVRIRSRKRLLIEAFMLGVLGLLAFLGLPPELSQIDPSRGTSLGVALLVAQAVLVTYFASACMIQEIGIEGEKAALDLLAGPFPPGRVVAGKSLASLLTIVYWLVLGVPLLALAAAIRQEPLGRLTAAVALIAVEAWGLTQVALLCSVVIDSEFSRTLAHWATLLLAFAVTLALPAEAQWLNPAVAATRAASGALPLAAGALYAAVGVACDGCARRALARFAGA